MCLAAQVLMHYPTTAGVPVYKRIEYGRYATLEGGHGQAAWVGI